MNEDGSYTLDDRPFKRDLETGQIMKDPETGEMIRMEQEEYDAYIADHRRKMRFADKTQEIDAA